jgi:hypothetical protein
MAAHSLVVLDIEENQTRLVALRDRHWPAKSFRNDIARLSGKIADRKVRRVPFPSPVPNAFAVLSSKYKCHLAPSATP